MSWREQYCLSCSPCRTEVSAVGGPGSGDVLLDFAFNCFHDAFLLFLCRAALGRDKAGMDRGLKPLLRVSIHINEFVAIKYDETEVGEGSSFRIDIGEGWVRRIVVESEKDFRKGEWGPGHFFYG